MADSIETKLLRQLGQIETTRAAARHRGIVIADSVEERGAIIAQRIAAGELAPHHGVIVLSRDVETAEEWERQARAYFARQPKT